MAYLQHNRIGFKRTSVPVTVPDNDVARLMYYLDCVCYSIQYNDNNINRYRKYQDWSSLSTEEVRLVLVLCLTISPDVLDNKVFFHSDALCGDSSNRFFEINQVTNQILAADSIVIAGRRCQVNKIMAYKISWMRTYYINPVKQVAARFSRNTSRASACTIS